VGNGFRGQGQGNLYSGTYNPGRKNQPNFSWSNQGQSQGKNIAPPGFSGQQAPSLESRVTRLKGNMIDLERALTRFVMRYPQVYGSHTSNKVVLNEEQGCRTSGNCT